ncbi:hypothetical protein THAOC_00588, partial [Thalassiosira oceanica]
RDATHVRGRRGRAPRAPGPRGRPDRPENDAPTHVPTLDLLSNFFAACPLGRRDRLLGRRRVGVKPGEAEEPDSQADIPDVSRKGCPARTPVE